MKPLPPVDFYHAHVYFDAASRESARALREAAVRELAGKARVHDLIDQPIGPHPLPMFEIDIPAPSYAAIWAWLEAHHEGHSVLVHPLTGDDMADHRDFPRWIGKSLSLDLAFLESL